MPLFQAAPEQPRQIFFMQHTSDTECSSMGNGIGKVQIGQESPSGLSCPWLYSCSSLSTATRCLHAFLCCLRWAFWQSTPQYLTRRQAVQFLSLTVSLDTTPQLAQAALSFVVPRLQLIGFYLPGERQNEAHSTTCLVLPRMILILILIGYCFDC